MKPIRPLFPVLSILLCWFAVPIHAQTAAPTPAPPADASQPSTATPGTIDPAKAAEIRKLLDLTGTVKMCNQMIDQMIGQFRATNSKVSPEFWDRFQKEVNTQDLVDQMIPIYDKYYTLDDLKAVNAFYETPAGQRMVAATPLIMRDSMPIGQNWGRALAQKIQDEMADEKEKAAAAAAAATPPPATPPTAPVTPPPATPTP